MKYLLTILQTLIVPAIIALLVFLLLTYLVIPVWQHYRTRYSHYLPVESLSNHTSSLRERIQGAMARMVVPSTWRQRLQERLVVADHEDIEINSEEGEELADVVTDSLRQRTDHPDHTRRLSREYVLQVVIVFRVPRLMPAGALVWNKASWTTATKMTSQGGDRHFYVILTMKRASKQASMRIPLL